MRGVRYDVQGRRRLGVDDDEVAVYCWHNAGGRNEPDNLELARPPVPHRTVIDTQLASG